MERLELLFENNKKWVASKIAQDPRYFSRMAKAQDPLYLWIGCSDSRVPANEIVGLEPGELFVHRNVANLFPHTDLNSLSVLEFGVDFLKIPHLIVCGHYGCAGVCAAMEDHHLGLVDNWLRNIRDVYAVHKKELESISSLEARQNRLVELNVMQQVLNISHTTIVQGAWARGQQLAVHGWVYDLATGSLRDLECTLDHFAQVDEVYKIRHSSREHLT